MGHTSLTLSTCAQVSHLTTFVDTIMKVLLLALFVGIALAGDCDEPRPEYCAKNVHLCKVPGFIDFMKKMCPRHCGYCKTEAGIDCVEPRPAFCAMNAFRCHQSGWEGKMKKLCPRTCGYCYYEDETSNDEEVPNKGCVEPRPEYCAKNKFLCHAAGFEDYMKEMCPRTCGYCLKAVGECIEPRPEYCAKNVHLCKVPGFIDFMKKMCPRHCGYC